jgi:hypothetical protein
MYHWKIKIKSTPFSFHIHEAMNHIIIDNFLFFLHIANKSITQVCIIHMVTKSCFHNLYPRKYSLPYCIAIGTAQVSKVDKPTNNKDFFCLHHSLWKLTDGIYVGESIVFSHISNIEGKVVAKIPRIIKNISIFFVASIRVFKF